MSLKEKLLDDLKTAMKDKDVIRKNVVQLIRSAVLQVEKDDRVTLDDDSILAVIAKELKKRRDALPEYENSGRQNLIDELKTEINILLGYLPPQLTEEEIVKIVDEAIEITGASTIRDMGKVMQEIKPRIEGRADGKTVSLIVKTKLK